MKFYFCSCSVCSWKGNRIHYDGQCPVCGHALKIKARRNTPKASSSSKVRISGLALEQKQVRPAVADAWKMIRSLAPKKTAKLRTGRSPNHARVKP